MSRFEPFTGLRYAPDRHQLLDVTAPPYDVLDDADRAALLAADPHNVVLVDLPDPGAGDDRYRAAAAVFERWRADGTLVEDPRPSFTVYRMGSTDDQGRAVHTLGVIGALDLSTPDAGQILPHEHTTPKAKSDRLDLLRATQVNLSPIWGLSLTEGLTALLETDQAPDVSFIDDEGVSHALWRVDDPERLDAIRAAVDASPVVIADGHHRFETSRTYRDERIAERGDPGEASRAMIYIVELVDEELNVRPIHRLVSGIDAPTLAAALEARFELAEAGVVDATVTAAMQDRGALCWVHADGTGTFLVPRAGAFEGVDDLDSSRLAAVLDGLTDATVRYQHGVDKILGALAAGDADHGVLLRPATVAQIDANARSGRRMPPKTTFFHPKPRTGLVFRSVR